MVPPPLLLILYMTPTIRMMTDFIPQDPKETTHVGTPLHQVTTSLTPPNTTKIEIILYYLHLNYMPFVEDRKSVNEGHVRIHALR